MSGRLWGRPIERCRAGGRGQALVEFALLAPVLIVLLLGIVDVGRLLFTYVALEDAVQEGAMYAAHEPTIESAIIQRVRTSADHPEVQGAAVTVTCTTTPAPGTITVTGTYDVPLLTSFGVATFGETFRIAATFVGTNFQGACP